MQPETIVTYVKVSETEFKEVRTTPSYTIPEKIVEVVQPLKSLVNQKREVIEGIKSKRDQKQAYIAQTDAEIAQAIEVRDKLDARITAIKAQGVEEDPIPVVEVVTEVIEEPVVEVIVEPVVEVPVETPVETPIEVQPI